MGKRVHETRTALEAYRDNVQDVDTILEMLKGSLADARAVVESRPLDWGHVGTVAHVRELLVDALACVCPADLGVIEEKIQACRRPHGGQ